MNSHAASHAAHIAATTVKNRRDHLFEQIRGSYAAYFFSMPAIVLMAIFMIYPLIWAFWLSFTNYHLIHEQGTGFVGTSNYAAALQDSTFRTGLWNTLVFTLFHVPISIGLALLLAALIQSAGKFGKICQMLLFIPVLIPEAMSAVVFCWLFAERVGIANHLMLEKFGFITHGIEHLFGFEMPQNWLGRPGWAMAAIVLTSYWGIGTNVILFSAGFAGIPRDLYEAAAVDGAGPWNRFKAITFPCLRHTTAVVSILAIIHSLKIFSLPYIMTNGGPGTSTTFLYQWIFQNAFIYFKLGYACAMAFLLALVVLAVAGLQLAVSKKD